MPAIVHNPAFQAARKRYLDLYDGLYQLEKKYGFEKAQYLFTQQYPLRQLARTYLLFFSTLHWPGFLTPPHIEILASALECVERREITRLIINMPPRHGKTMAVSEYFASWVLGKNPAHQLLAATYSFDRASDVGLKVKQIVEHNVFKDTFPKCRLSRDTKSKNKMAFTEGGNYFSVGVGGALTGRGADLMLLDDVVKSREEAESELVRNRIGEWFRGTAYTRLMPNGAIILIMTRWHVDDLAGRLIDEYPEDWWVLSLPALADTTDDPLGREYGEALWPDRYPADVLEQIKHTILSKEFISQYQQRPFAEEGSMVRLDWFKRYDAPPDKFKRIIQSWDTAYKSKELNDPSCCTTWGVTQNGLYLLDVWKRRVDYPSLKRCAVTQYNKWKPDMVLIEDKASGQSLIQDLQSATRIPIKAIKPVSDKITRFSSVTGEIEGGRVFLPVKARWLYDYETELCQFPYGKNDDQVDSTSQALMYLKRPIYVPSSKILFWK